MKTLKLGNWTQGMVNCREPQALPHTQGRYGAALLDAVNVDIDRDGVVDNRDSWTLLHGGKAHSPFEHEGVHYAVVDGDITRIADRVVLGEAHGAVSWCVVNGEAVAVDGSGVRRVVGNKLTGYANNEVVEDAVDTVIRPMPGGNHAAYFRGRLLVATLDALYYSEPMRFGVTDAMRNFVTLPGRITWLVALDNSVWLATEQSVYQLRGAEPSQWQLDQRADKSAAGSGVRTDDMRLHEGATGPAALWFGEHGFSFGDDDGGVFYPQRGRIRLKDFPRSGRIFATPDRVTFLTGV